MMLATESYTQQLTRWPLGGRVILAQFDSDSVVVYQAYKPAIGDFAAKNGYFGGSFKFTRMTWIKPNFLWMMYRCGWGTKGEQEVVLAIRMQRSAFDHILSLAVHSSFQPDVYGTRDEWKQAANESDVRLQWDPDHDPQGAKIQRRAVQLGMRGDTLAKYARDWILDVQDVSGFVAKQRVHAMSGKYDQLLTPTEHVYPVNSGDVSARLGISTSTPGPAK